MKNLKIKTKLMLGFALVALLTVAVGLTGIAGLMMTSTTHTEFSNGAIEGISTLGDIRELFQQQRLMLRALIVDMANPEQTQTDITNLRTYEAAMKKAMLAYEATIFDPSAEVDYYAFKNAYEGNYRDVKERFTNAAISMDFEAATTALADGAKAAAPIIQSLQGVMDYVNQALKEQSNLASRSVETMNAILAAVMLLTAAAAVALGLYISSIISKPLGFMSSALNQIGTTGNLQLSEDTARSAAAEVRRKDEIGVCARACVGLIQHLHSLEQTLDQVSQGDLSVEVKVMSPQDNIGRSVARVVESMNSVFGEISASTAQVAAGSRQIADGSQALAEGTAEQAAATEELSVSVSEIAENTTENARLASSAAALAEEIKKKADQSSRQMNQMMTAVKEIGEASHSISKVINVIDDIAFQTNILALNAAVEAARAGQHGKGFAVVAEEVRGLAAKSAAAAKDTGNLIENSITKAGLGVRIAGETAESMAEIIASINESGKLIQEIAASSEKQSHAISQINRGIDQVAQVIQQNSATAQQSAAASEEMSEQTGTLESMMTHFRLKTGDVR